MSELFPGESEPIATNPILRGVDIAIGRLVQRDCFTTRTLEILDDLRAEVLGVTTQAEVRAHYAATVEGVVCSYCVRRPAVGIDEDGDSICASCAVPDRTSRSEETR
ncbi:hypothetical protein [Microbacterium sp. NPDC056052]|uniref:hypothetical protein n=1 Tax=Microbacterium sp. NPDC056052 TaxID=3345695 RepID=UPI0035DEBC1D